VVEGQLSDGFPFDLNAAYATLSRFFSNALITVGLEKGMDR
jgi:hypothetical protein